MESTFNMVSNSSYNQRSTPAVPIPRSSHDHGYSSPQSDHGYSNSRSSSLAVSQQKSTLPSPQKVQSTSSNHGPYFAVLVACIVVIVALAGLGIAVFVTFTNIREVQSQITLNTNPTLLDKIQQLNLSLTEMIRSINNSQSVQIVQLVEETVQTSELVMQGI